MKEKIFDVFEKKVYEDVSTVSVEKYKNFKFVPVNLKRYEEHFKKFFMKKINRLFLILLKYICL